MVGITVKMRRGPRSIVVGTYILRPLKWLLKPKRYDVKEWAMRVV